MLEPAPESNEALLAEWKSLVRLRSSMSSGEGVSEVEVEPRAVGEGGAEVLKAA